MVFSLGSSRLLLFGRDGAFLRRLEVPPVGDSRASVADAQFAGRDVVMLDENNLRFVVMSLEGQVRHEAVLPVRQGRFRVVSESTVVVGSLDRSSDLVGYPLHLIHVRSGQPLSHFGSADGQWSVTTPLGEDIVLGLSANSGRVWKGDRALFQIEEWQVGGPRTRRIAGDLPWFPRGNKHVRSEGPRTILLDFGIDANDRLWSVLLVPDVRWRTVKAHGDEGFILAEDLHRYYDARIDVFDLRRKRLAASVTWDGPSAALLVLNGEIAAYRVEGQGTSARIAFYGVGSDNP